MTEETSGWQACSRCGAKTDVCAFCEGPDCLFTICYECLNLALQQAVAQPHAHGG